jgi:nucleotide-binding universal stress UspA family protein
LLAQITQEVQARNVPLYTKIRVASNVSDGILDEVKSNNIKLILAGWPGPIDPIHLGENPVKVILQKAHTNIAVLLDRDMREIRHILVPVGGGSHSRLALRLAYEIAANQRAHITALHIFSEHSNVEEIEDNMLQLEDIIEDELGAAPSNMTARVVRAESVSAGIRLETNRQSYDLVVLGASEEWISQTRLFGSISDWIADHIHCSTLLVRCYEPVAIAWIKRQIKLVGKEYNQNNDQPTVT